MSTTAAATGKLVRLDEIVPISWSGGEQGRFLLRAEDTDNRFSYYQVIVPAGEGTVTHLHEAMDETFHVVDGEFEITVGDQVHHATAGTLVYGARGIAHAFRNIGDRPGTLLCITAPGGIEIFFEELSELLHEDPPAEPVRLRELAARHRIVTFPDGRPSAGDN
jgi:mannose-6-phosphate isomerase-like protein (cupin superfamily)